MQNRAFLVAWTCSLICALHPTLRAQECVDYADSEPRLAVLQASGFQAVAVSGTHAFLVGSGADFRVIDISDPRSPQVVGSIEMPVSGQSVAVGIDYACVATGTGLYVIDIENPASPQVTGSVDTPGSAIDVAVSGSYACVADWDSGLEVIDISNPASPRIVGSLDTPGEALDVAVEGDHAYLATGSSGLLVINISDPASPRVVGSLAPMFDGDIYEVAAAGGHVCVLDSRGGPTVVDVADPESPHRVGSMGWIGYAADIAVSGAYAFVANAYVGLRVFDLTQPSAPKLTATYSITYDTFALAVTGELALALGEGKLHVLDVSYPVSSANGSIDLPAFAITSAGERMVTLSGPPWEVHVIDISSPMAPQIVGSVSLAFLGPDNLEVTMSGDYAYVDGTFSDLEVIDIGTPTAPHVIGRVPTDGRTLAVSGGFVYVGGAGVEVVDVRDPTSPQIVGNALTKAIDGVAAKGNYVYAVRDSFWVIDVGDPMAPHAVASIDLLETGGLSRPRRLTVTGDHAYVVGYGWLYVINISNPLAPWIAGSTELDIGGPVAVAGDFAYIAGDYLQVVDIGTPTNVQLIGSAITGGLAMGLALANDLVYVVDGADVLIFHEQCDASVPVFLSDFDVQAGATVEIRWRVMGLADEEAFRLIASSKAVGWEVSVGRRGAHSFAARDDSPHLATSGAVTYTLFYREPDGCWLHLAEQRISMNRAPNIQLLTPYPNPFNPRTTIPFALATPQDVRLTIHDAAGREVVRLVQGAMPSGLHAVMWHGQDARGRRVGSGVYFARLQTKQGLHSQKLVLAK